MQCPGFSQQLHCGTYVRDLGYAKFALLATTRCGLQQLVNAAHEFCMETGMVICPDKIKVVVFCAGLPEPYPWQCGGTTLHQK